MTGNQLKIELKKLNITQEDAADKLGVTRRTLQNWFSLVELDANISQSVKMAFGISDISVSSNEDIKKLIETIETQAETINRQSKIIENLTNK